MWDVMYMSINVKQGKPRIRALKLFVMNSGFQNGLIFQTIIDAHWIMTGTFTGLFFLFNLFFDIIFSILQFFKSNLNSYRICETYL